MHTLGFYHEQTRPDRGNYVDYDEDWVLPSGKNDFKIRQIKMNTDMKTDYDIGSIMHYSASEAVYVEKVAT